MLKQLAYLADAIADDITTGLKVQIAPKGSYFLRNLINEEVDWDKFFVVLKWSGIKTEKHISCQKQFIGRLSDLSALEDCGFKVEYLMLVQRDNWHRRFYLYDGELDHFYSVAEIEYKKPLGY
jgi:hypothetical protein